MTSVTRRYRFSASHRLHSGQLSEEHNQEIYGKCNNPYGHGHDYVLDVTVDGPVQARSGLVVPIGALDRLIEAEVLTRFAGKNLNTDVPGFASVVPTTENLAREIGARLRSAWSSAFAAGGPALAGIRLHETDRNRVDLRLNGKT